MSDDNIRIVDPYVEQADLKWQEGIANHFKHLMKEVLYEEGLIENDPNYNQGEEWVKQRKTR